MIDTAALREKVLDLAIRGKLVPQDPNDEPASVLLERIRQQKQQMVKDGKLKPKDIKGDTVIFVGDDNLHYEKFADGTVKCIEDEIPFDLPDGWVWSRLASICSLISDIDHKMPKAVDDGVLFLSAKDLLNDGTINYTDDVKMISEEDFLRLSKKALPQKNDIIYSRIGACLGKARVVTKDIRFIVSYSCCTIRPVIIDPTFLASILDGDFVLDQAKEGTQSVGVPDLGMASIKQFLIPIPPLIEQQRIDERLQYALNIVQQISTERDDLSLAVAQAKSKILDLAIRGKLVPQNPDDEPASVLLERIRAEKEELIRQGKIKRDKKESVIFRGEDNSYYEKFCDGTVRSISKDIPFALPNGWEWCRLNTLFNVCSAKRVLQSEWQTEGIPFYRAREIVRLSNDGYVNNDLFISEAHYRQLMEHYGVPKAGDLMVTGVGTIGKVYVVKAGDVFYYKDASVLCFENCYHAIIPDFAKILMDSTLLQNQIHSQTYGNTVDTITISTAGEYLCLLPPLKEQVRIVDIVSQLYLILNNIEKSLS